MNIHLHGNQGPECRRNCNGEESGRNKQEISLFTQKLRNNKIIDGIVICRDKNQIAKLYGHGFAERNRISPEYNHP